MAYKTNVTNQINAQGANYSSVPCSGMANCQCGACNQWSNGINYSPYTVVPYPTATTTATWGSYFNNTKYSVLNLPRKKKMPRAVYVAGKMLTLGLLGSDVEVAFTGSQIVFSPGTLATTGSSLTLIIDYADESYHYNLFKGLLGLSFSPGSQILLDPQLLSVVKGK
jgi:hypothetical protein